MKGYRIRRGWDYHPDPNGELLNCFFVEGRLCASFRRLTRMMEAQDRDLMKIVANRARCTGHARCFATAPKIFDLDDHGYIGFNERKLDPDELELARRGVHSCPEGALRMGRD